MQPLGPLRTISWTGQRHTDVAQQAERQHGLITHAQLERAGLSRSAVRHAVSSRRLWRVHRGVFGVGCRKLSEEGIWLAAVLACGDDAALSHTTAAALWGVRALAS